MTLHDVIYDDNPVAGHETSRGVLKRHELEENLFAVSRRGIAAAQANGKAGDLAPYQR